MGLYGHEGLYLRHFFFMAHSDLKLLGHSSTEGRLLAHPHTCNTLKLRVLKVGNKFYC